uniref:Spondin domain-containing protein n=1 Tax=Compsopogon caeruleus TaxID=31354 RepID=A0A7S1TE69_9RHOD|mmetsp:Transcript_16487/g.33661  ORF Transcript_16487/g.33661 Transcript_16487/m.33661 type:complete len:213 (+) Transcript_16487:79-717(+)|eukprot:CAMPEP_0184682320 /NCGR_PEP_ID=MMETSP0312-20130426/6766_1 /TAXON_ID=31354 /ORGANISM="Compsopogon coeruleus, Strain SAG 36.94" /LENGTH=212 /DNA_ID=CAMNT_0027133909 /DNA_START=23 /DNA_END=661 /DNA_ORIENTATION=+
MCRLFALTLGSIFFFGLSVEGLCSGKVKYQIAFHYNWTLESHPVEYPSFPHFSWLVGVSHNKFYTFWNVNGFANNGIQNIAELGDVFMARKEFNTERNVYNFDVGSLSRAVDLDLVAVEVDGQSRRTLLSAASMIAPSPDWFVGFSRLQTCRNRSWVASMDGVLVGYDAGTDSGGSYESFDQVTNPIVPIRKLVGDPTRGVLFGTYEVSIMA